MKTQGAISPIGPALGAAVLNRFKLHFSAGRSLVSHPPNGRRDMIARSFLTLFAFALVAAAGGARSEERNPWDGVWVGSFGSSAPISVTVTHDRVTTYLYRGADLPIAYSRIGVGVVNFGDRANYAVSLSRVSADAAKAVYHGRNGYARTTLMRQ
jgi:hypothetical protein